VGELCVGWGFCGTPDAAPFDRRRVSWTAEEFAREVLRAEGDHPSLSERWFKPIHDKFMAQFGASISVEDFTEEGAARRLALLGGSDPSASARRRRRRS
jgi:hypothetical protein